MGKQQDLLNDALQVSTEISKQVKKKFKDTDNLFEQWVFEEILPRGIKSLRSSSFYDFARKRVITENLAEEAKQEFEILIRKTWKIKENAGRIKRMDGKRNAYELDYSVNAK